MANQQKSEPPGELLSQIEEGRKLLSNAAELFGLNHPVTLALSEHLDNLIAIEQRRRLTCGV